MLLRFVRFHPFVSDDRTAAVAERDEGKGNESVWACGQKVGPK
jgi:hypothetical protein